MLVGRKGVGPRITRLNKSTEGSFLWGREIFFSIKKTEKQPKTKQLVKNRVAAGWQKGVWAGLVSADCVVSIRAFFF